MFGSGHGGFCRSSFAKLRFVDGNPLTLICGLNCSMGQFGEVYLATQTVKPGTGENQGNIIHRAVKLLKDGANPADRVCHACHSFHCQLYLLMMAVLG